MHFCISLSLMQMCDNTNKEMSELHFHLFICKWLASSKDVLTYILIFTQMCKEASLYTSTHK